LTHAIRALANLIAILRARELWDVALFVFWGAVTLIVVLAIVKHLYLNHFFYVNGS